MTTGVHHICPEASMQYTHDRYCGPIQVGYGLSRYKGIPYQKGYGLYQGNVFQRGFGLGGNIGNFFRATLRPALRRVKDMALPAAKKVGKKAAKRAGQKAIQMAMERKWTKNDVKQALKEELHNMGTDAYKEVAGLLPGILQSGRGQASLKRKRKIQGQSTSSKRQRKTIFD